MDWCTQGRSRRARRTRRNFTPTALTHGNHLEPRLVLSTLPSGFTESVVASGFDYPGSMTVAPDGRIFVAEKSGAIRIIKDGRVLPEPFAIINPENTVSQGLMGLAFDPQFPVKPFVYVYYVTKEGGLHNRLSRLTVDGDKAVPGSEKILYESETFQIAPGDPAHNGGAIDFGPDGKIYVSTGDMMNANHAQQLSNTFGKILRINPDGSAPKDNPFYRRTRGKARYIWAYGLRNPYTITFQPGTGRLYINDVGGAVSEEINLGKKGANYGWPIAEGPTTKRGIDGPIYAYNHGQPGPRLDSAVIGGAFYNPANPSFPQQYYGKYFFSDYARGFIRILDPATNSVSTFAPDAPHGVVDVDLDSAGRLYYLTIDDGAVHVIQYSPEEPPVLTRPLEDETVPLNQAATLAVSPQGTYPFTYQWQANEQDIDGATGPSLTIPPDQIDPNVAYRVVITNEFGSHTSNEARVSSSNDAAPKAKIVKPANNAAFRIGQEVQFTGLGYDVEAAGGLLPQSAFHWRLDLLHNGHVHPNTYVVDGRDSGSFRVPRHDDPGHFALRLTLTVTDSAGQSDSESVIIQTGAMALRRRRR